MGGNGSGELEGFVKGGEGRMKKREGTDRWGMARILALDYIFYTTATRSTAGDGLLICRFILIICVIASYEIFSGDSPIAPHNLFILYLMRYKMQINIGLAAVGMCLCYL